LDFTLDTYKKLLNTLRNQGFSFTSFDNFVSNQGGKRIILRHDVDSLPANSLKFARIQSETGIKGTYYFRIVPESFDEKIILEIYKLGHEVGYHYEDFVFASQKLRIIKNTDSPDLQDLQDPQDLQDCRTARQQDNGRFEKKLADIAIESFNKNLERLRVIVPVKTICMHGSPLSRWDSRLLWKYYDYHDFGIIGEPYFDVNFDEVLYLTDTGRRWDGDSFNVRDRAQGSEHRAQGKNPAPRTPHPAPFPKFHSTFDIIRAAEEGKLPDKIMMTFHAQRWTDRPVPWVKELVWQNVKNVGKYFLVKIR
jgi:hypothetical protein